MTIKAEKVKNCFLQYFRMYFCILMMCDCNHRSERWRLALSFVGLVTLSTPAVMSLEYAPIYTTSMRSAQPQ